ncbi:MAG: hypothetical protein Q3M24_14130 [Candidatus Electrothrix aestuarii]|uniref:Uncharacterized protein n=1 Tax=Candidatus Electrothrix aestuarii TaxID=3062594 RepID=A0AAU8LQX8_9BACT|nr:hypothetical protein [Candidatus Electrothrix aestuarii]WPD24805.1 MAG: hypothetical protein SD837_09610 [Candidatus Electrothrix sp. GW3-3]
MKGKTILALGIGLGIFLTSCGSERPFSARYTSPNQVIITYQGKQYTLNRYGIAASVPFAYRFEDDGDLDLTIGGKLYEVDSPYDRDKDKKKVKKKKPMKKSVKKTARTKPNTKTKR